MRIGSISELEYIKRAWTFRLNSMQLYYLGVIKEYNKRLERLAKFKERALAVEGDADVKKMVADVSNQKKLQ